MEARFLLRINELFSFFTDTEDFTKFFHPEKCIKTNFAHLNIKGIKITSYFSKSVAISVCSRLKQPASCKKFIHFENGYLILLEVLPNQKEDAVKFLQDLIERGDVDNVKKDQVNNLIVESRYPLSFIENFYLNYSKKKICKFILKRIYTVKRGESVEKESCLYSPSPCIGISALLFFILRKNSKIEDRLLDTSRYLFCLLSEIKVKKDFLIEKKKNEKELLKKEEALQLSSPSDSPVEKTTEFSKELVSSAIGISTLCNNESKTVKNLKLAGIHTNFAALDNLMPIVGRGSTVGEATKFVNEVSFEGPLLITSLTFIGLEIHDFYLVIKGKRSFQQFCKNSTANIGGLIVDSTFGLISKEDSYYRDLFCEGLNELLMEYKILLNLSNEVLKKHVEPVFNETSIGILRKKKNEEEMKKFCKEVFPFNALYDHVFLHLNEKLIEKVDLKKNLDISQLIKREFLIVDKESTKKAIMGKKNEKKKTLEEKEKREKETEKKE